MSHSLHSTAVLDWQHIFIPSLPCGLLTMLDAPMPYLIGIKRYLLQKIDDGDAAFDLQEPGSNGYNPSNPASTASSANNTNSSRNRGNSGSIYGNNMEGVVFLDVDSGVLEVLGQSSQGVSDAIIALSIALLSVICMIDCISV